MKDEYYNIVNGKLELTPEGHKFLQEQLQSQVLQSFNVPGPLVGNWQPPKSYSYAEIVQQIMEFGFDRGKLRAFYERYVPGNGIRSAWLTPGTSVVPSSLAGAMTGRFQRRDPTGAGSLIRQSLTGGAVDKPKIPVSGMQGFSEHGTPEEWDLAIGEVYGYRWWKLSIPAKLAGYIEAPDMTLNPQELRLVGANHQPWDAGRLEAKCTASSYTSPSWDDLLNGRSEPFKHEPPEIREACGCGFWAYFDQFLSVDSHFTKLGAGKPYKVSNHCVEIPVFGVVKGSGRVIIGEKGFRCQYAEIVGLALPDIAFTQLGWWTTMDDMSPVNNYSERYSPRSPNRYRNNMYRALTGQSGWYQTDDVPEGRTEEASRDEVMGRVAMIEGLLSVIYPAAKLMSDQDALRAYYPPDKNYGRGA